MVFKDIFATLKITIATIYLDTYTREVYKVFSQSGRSSGVERNLAKVEVEGSNPFARSIF